MGRPHIKSTYKIHNPIGIRLLKRLGLGLCYLNENKFSHDFADCVDLSCSCSIEPNTTLHFFLRCHNFLRKRRKLFDKINILDEILLQLNEDSLLTALLFRRKIVFLK